MVLNHIPIPRNPSPEFILKVVNSCAPGTWVDPPIQQAQFTAPQAGAIFRLWRSIGAHPKTALWATLVAYRESRFDGTAVNPDSGAIGLYQALSPRFKRVAMKSSRLEDALPVMKEMFVAYGMDQELTLHELYAAHFQGMYAQRGGINDLRGFVDENGSTYGAQYSTTNGSSSVNDLGYLTISALCDLPDIAAVQSSYLLTLPTRIDDRRKDGGRFDYMGPVIIYRGDRHLRPGEMVSADSFDVLGDFTPFRSDRKILITYTNPSLLYESAIQYPLH
jgi:hypothetical protein